MRPNKIKSLAALALAVVSVVPTLWSAASSSAASACTVGTSSWKAEYFANDSLAGSPKVCRQDAEPAFDWATASPIPGSIPTDRFSVRWQKNVQFSAGTYTFYAGADDSVRLFIDGVQVINSWVNSSYNVRQTTRTLTAGYHLIRLHFRENTGNAKVSLSWTAPGGATTTTLAPTTTLATTTTLGTTTTTAPATTTTLPSTSTGKFYVVGKDIIAPDGSKFIPIGANVGADVVSWSPPTYAFTSQGHYANGHVNEAIAWGWNMVRVNVICDMDGTSVTMAETIAGVQSLIDEYTAHNIVVMPSCHDVTGADISNLSSPVYVKILQFWDAIVAANKNNPYVWINPVNEPFTQWGANDPNWAATANALYSRFRATGSENIFLWDLSGWGQGIEDTSNSSTAVDLAANKCNIAFGWHNYGAQGSNTNLDWHWGRTKAKNLAIIITEFGYDWAGTRSNTTTYANDYLGGNWAMSHAFSEGTGALVWHGTDSAGTMANNLYALRLNGQGGWYDTTNPLSDMGQKMLNLGTVNRPAKTYPAVNLSSSNCASVAGGSGTTTTTTTPVTTSTLVTTTTTPATTTTAVSTTTTLPPTTTVPGTNVYGRPFAASSPWNTPTPASATWSDLPALHSVPFGDSIMHWWVDNTLVSVVYSQPSDPVWTLNVPNYIDPTNGRNRPATSFTVRAPASVANRQGAGSVLVIVDGSTYYEIGGVAVNTTTRTITGGSSWATGSYTTGPGAGSANNDGIRGANTSMLGGLLTGRDFANGTIDHALAVALPWHMLNGAPGAGYRYPATAYAAGGWTGPIQMGSKIGIPASTPMPAGLSPAGVMMFNALKTYGAYVTDYVGGAWPSFYADANTVSSPQTEPIFAYWASGGSSDMEKLVPLLRVMN